MRFNDATLTFGASNGSLEFQLNFWCYPTLTLIY